VPSPIRKRKKQPYRAPDALAFIGPPAAPAWIEEVADARALHEAGVFDPAAARALIEKCTSKNSDVGQFSNADNMALVGVLSTQILWSRLVAHPSSAEPPRRVQTVVDRLDTAAGQDGVR
jgi:asparagine synthase (glutamine-hydrolysing)